MEGALFKLKRNKVKVWQEWLEALKTTWKDEVALSLKEEGLSCEHWTVFNIGDDFYTMGFGVREKKGKVNKERMVNMLHQEKKQECFDNLVTKFSS